MSEFFSKLDFDVLIVFFDHFNAVKIENVHLFPNN